MLKSFLFYLSPIYSTNFLKVIISKPLVKISDRFSLVEMYSRDIIFNRMFSPIK